MEKRDKDLLKKMELIHEAFYNNQFNRDEKLLGIIKERDMNKKSRQRRSSRDSSPSIYPWGKIWRKRWKEEIKCWMTTMLIRERLG